MLGISSTSLSPQGNGRQSPRVENNRDRPPNASSRIKGENWRLALGEGEVRRITLRIFIVYIFRNRLQSTCVALMVFREAITSEESQ